MGQIESKELDSNHQKNDLTSKQVSEPNHVSNDLNIKIDDNQSNGNEANDADNKPEESGEKKSKKAKSCDFACTIFYAMVALLLFSTMSRTYTTYHHSGGGCGAMYGLQPLLAYTCVGLACAIIKSLRKQIKEQNNQMSNTEENSGEMSEDETKTDSNGYELLKESESPPTPIAPTFKHSYYDSNEDKPRRDLESETKTVRFIGDTDYSGQESNKLSSILPLPELPAPNSLVIGQPNAQNQTNLDVLSAVDLKAIDTNVVKQEKLNDKLIADLDFVINNNGLNKTKSENKVNNNSDNSCRINDYNWMDYNLENINKY